MIHDIRDAFNDLLEENDWMDKETRQVAEDKANSMTERIGYPEYITNDTRLQEEYANVRNLLNKATKWQCHVFFFSFDVANLKFEV
jgi:predicted metalloendopeptidase